jgi:Flp pilus assembly protein TadD
MALLRLVARSSLPLLLLVAAGCTTYTPPDTAPAPVEERPEQPVMVPPAPKPPPSTPPRPAPSASAAWQPLLAKAEQATQRGDYEEALALLERAQRIEPDSGEVYLSMARTHRAKGDVAQARATAERGLLYCSTDAMCDALRGFTR